MHRRWLEQTWLFACASCAGSARVPHALAGWARHELELGQTVLLEAVHGNVVAISLRVCETQAAALRARLD
ncbi:MAG: hypothetical protein A2486_04505 [Burkholderiales bacterium RIFOXYC12_FULL_65_23]|nr:MAG: hypothetical protein A2486_04505 [Burkholderiales bacterium RIFOXYC12_FULL_65_23]